MRLVWGRHVEARDNIQIREVDIEMKELEILLSR
jgi:hypothetical protein